MEVVALQFQTPRDMAAFRKLVAAQVLEVNIKELYMACRCTWEEIAIALNYHGARVIDPVI